MGINKINENIEELLNRFEVSADGEMVDTETGEILDSDQKAEVTKELRKLCIEKEEATENLAVWILDMNSMVTAIKAQEKVLKERRESLERKAERVSRFLEFQLDGQKLESGRVKVSYRTSTKVNVTDEEALSKEFLRVRVTTEPDKSAIKNALKAGKTVAGAELIESRSMIIK